MLYEGSQSQDISSDFIYMKCIEKTNLYRQKIAQNRRYRGNSFEVCGDDCITLNILKITELYVCFKRVNVMRVPE